MSTKSKLFESILEAEKPGFDLENGWFGLDGKFKKFYKPDMTYDIKDDCISKTENTMKDRLRSWEYILYGKKST